MAKDEIVNYTEYEPDPMSQAIIDSYVNEQPWVLISLYEPSNDESDLGISLEAGGGLTFDGMERMLKAALKTYKKARKQQLEQDPDV